MSDKPLNEDIHYLNGQIDALTALVLAIAGSTMDKEQFRQQALARLDSLETMTLPKSVPEARLRGIEDMRRWLLAVTA